jgi:hypothetical protein
MPAQSAPDLLDRDFTADSVELGVDRRMNLGPHRFPVGLRRLRRRQTNGSNTAMTIQFANQDHIATPCQRDRRMND